MARNFYFPVMLFVVYSLFFYNQEKPQKIIVPAMIFRGFLNVGKNKTYFSSFTKMNVRTRAMSIIAAAPR